MMSDDELEKQWDYLEDNYDNLIKDTEETLLVCYIGVGVIVSLTIGIVVANIISHLI